MKSLSDIGLQTRTINALNDKNIYTPYDLVRYFPIKYLDYRNIFALPDAVNKDCAICGYLESFEKKQDNGKTIVGAEIIEESTGERIHVKWFGQSYQFNGVRQFARKEVVVCGKVIKHVRYGYCISNPFSYHLRENYKGKIIPVYRKIKNVSEDMLKKSIDKSIDLMMEPLNNEVLQKSKLMGYQASLRLIHHPVGDSETVEEIIKPAGNRIIFNDMLYFALQLKLDAPNYNKHSTFTVRKSGVLKRITDMLPYELTKDQLNAIYTIKKQMATGNRVNMLIQGDVGCGKTTIALMAMLLIAENGYQSVLLAPTTVLAKQHFEELSAYGNRLGYPVAFLSSECKGKEKKQLLADIKSGKYSLIVGTHSVFSENVEYQSLGLIITDEEHRFGVEQRHALEAKASSGVHVISMSATPIPRTMAEVLYGEQKEIVTIATMPGGRKPVQTAVNRSDEKIFAFIAKQLNLGRQAYVVCPLIEDTEDNEGEIESVEATLIKYAEFFEPYGVKVGCVTGQMDNDLVRATIDKFRRNEIQILVSTTVIEVGVNVPNASVIVINNAERFGLAQLHQLRGRVGRGEHQSYCILKSKDRNNERLVTMEQTTNGFEIAQADIKQRGFGDLFGTAQSGNNHYLDLVIKMPHLYECIKKYAEWLISTGTEMELILMYE